MLFVEKFLRDFCADNGWELVHTLHRPGRSQKVFSAGGLGLHAAAQKYLTHSFPLGIYRHQMEAIAGWVRGKDVAITTSTASGKSAVFYASALELLSREPESRILAVYPQKALGREQEHRWLDAFRVAGLPRSLLRLDGDVHVSQRPTLLRKASVVLATPDVLHAWLLPNVGESTVWDFVKRIRLIVVDEVHVYSGVFGSNSAFLFRRLEHLMSIAGARASFIVASATVRDPESHFKSLFGRNFTIIDESCNTSRKHDLVIHMINPDHKRDFLSSLAGFLQEIVNRTSSRFIVFVDSRKQTELLAAILARSQKKDPNYSATDQWPDGDYLNSLDVLPYRAGYEDSDRARIHERLSSGKLRGIVSTSALELGIDVAGLDLGVLVGVPRSKTSFEQRIGRVGRSRPGTVVVLNGGDIFSETMFRRPSEILDRPLAESALYLENPRVQYIHAMCLARAGGEHDRACERAGRPSEECISSGVDWPAGFLALCERERAGEIAPDLQSMKMEAGDFPHTTYPLRDIEVQFAVECRQGMVRDSLGALSHGQLLREAYPGAVYYYTAKPYRVYQVLPRSRTVLVRREKSYTTKPLNSPSSIYPNLTEGNIYGAVRHGTLILVEANLQVRDTVYGFRERRGLNEDEYRYPLDAQGDIIFHQPAFTRNYFTTGVLIVHPSLCGTGVAYEQIAELLYEGFLMAVPFERQDINWAVGRLKTTRGFFREGTRYMALYDQTYGSLRLSGRILDPVVTSKTFRRLLDLAGHESLSGAVAPQTMECVVALSSSIGEPRESITSELSRPEVAVSGVGTSTDTEKSRYIPVILPGSSGLDRMNGNEEFYVSGVFYGPDGLRYRGRHPSDYDPTVTVTIPVENLVPIPGESRFGHYDLETGETIPE